MTMEFLPRRSGRYVQASEILADEWIVHREPSAP
jgi:hypothetical protein